MTVQWKPDVRVDRYLALLVARKHERPDEEAADKYEMSKAALYQQLANDGFPVCPACGILHPDEEHLRGHDAKKPRRRRPRGRAGEARELPPASRAGSLFTPTIQALERAVGEMDFLKEWSLDGRFVTEFVYPVGSGKYNVLFSRKDFEESELDPGAAWKEACREHGQDPQVEEFLVPMPRVIAGGAGRHPHDLLVRLVAAYALSDRAPAPLLEVIHPDPQEGDVKAFEEKRKELWLKARHLAAVVRGDRDASKGGRKPEPVLPDQQKASRYRDKPDDRLPPWLRERGRGENDIGSLRLPRAEEPDPE